jgi:hypothetical protein
MSALDPEADSDSQGASEREACLQIREVELARCDFLDIPKKIPPQAPNLPL